MTANLNVLMVAYYYPPRGGGGVQRTVKFAKYLPSHGIRPVVLTSNTTPGNLRDTSYEVAEDIVRVPFKEPGRITGRLLEYVRLERNAGWVRRAIRAALETAHEQGIDVIYSTASPYINHVVARHVARELGVPWVVDFRDLWTSNALYRPRSPFVARKHRALEQACYQEATEILVTSPHQRDVVMRDFKVEPSKITIITNGFDSTDFAGNSVAPTEKPKAIAADAKIVIGYLGSFYAAYRPDDLVLALKLLNKKKPDTLNNVQFLFVGDYDRGSLAALTSPDLRNLICVSTYVPHAELVELRKKMQAFLLYLPDAGEEIRAMIPQKVFEYLAARKPIFAVVPPSDVRDMLVRLKAASFARSGKPIEIARHLEQFIRELRDGKAPRATGSLAEFERKHLTTKLAQVIERATHHDQR